MTHKTQVNIRIPDVENLYCINCKVNPVDMRDPLVKSLFHSQILTCRLIIYTMRCCIASPSIQNADDLIHVIVNKSFYDSGKFQEHLSKLKVDYTDPEPVHPKIYEACLKYTFTFRLAPHWNSIGKSYYLQGFNFLSLTSNINAIEWNILFKQSSDIKLELIPLKMNLLPLTLDSLSLPPKTVDGFTVNRNINSIDLTSFESPWVYVLPKLTRARIVSVSKILPQSCPFSDYNDLRRHWKNMYSYRLPKSGQEILFYEVVFPNQPNQYFTYPEMCILSRMPELLMCENKNEVASQFLKDLSTNVHSVCGDVMQICHLYPELDIEYSCVVKQRICENQYSQSQHSSFFKTPRESIIKPVSGKLFKTPRESIIKPVSGKLNLSSLFTFKGMNKMRPDMQNHTQRVLSIMQNNKRKKNSVLEDDNEYFTQSTLNKKKRMFEMSQKYLPSIPEIKQERTVVDNLNDILSYHDLPSMRSKHQELEESGQDKNFQQKEELVDPMHQSYRPKPVIKNVQDVRFNLTDDHSLTNVNELEINENEAKKEDGNLLNKVIYNTTKPMSKLSNPKEKEDISQNSVFDQCKKELSKSLPFDQDYKYCKLQSSISSIDLDSKVLSKLLPKQNPDKTVDSIETQSYDKKIRSFLHSFDLYNIHGHEEIDIEKEMRELNHQLPANSDVNDNDSIKTCTKNRLNTSFEKSEFQEDNLNDLKNNTSLDKGPDKSSVSLLDLKKGSNTDLHNTYSGKVLQANLKHLESRKDCLFKNDSILKNGHECHPQSVSTTSPANSERVSTHKNNEQKCFDTSPLSIFTHDTFKESINRKLLQSGKFTTDEKDLQNQVECTTYPEFSHNTDAKSSENSCRKLHDRSFTSGNFQDTCKTPSLNSYLHSVDNGQLWNNISNTPQCSTDILESHIQMQNINALQYKDINEFADKSDFTSILSESSSGSDTNDYESCKLVFNEALTLKK